MIFPFYNSVDTRRYCTKHLSQCSQPNTVVFCVPGLYSAPLTRVKRAILLPSACVCLFNSIHKRRLSPEESELLTFYENVCNDNVKVIKSHGYTNNCDMLLIGAWWLSAPFIGSWSLQFVMSLLILNEFQEKGCCSPTLGLQWS